MCFGAILPELTKYNYMNDKLEQTILEMVRTYLRSLSDTDFLALTCNLTNLCGDLIRAVYDEAIRRQAKEIHKPKKEQQFKYLNKIVAAVFDRSVRHIRRIMEDFGKRGHKCPTC